MIYIGIDVGAKGGIAVIQNEVVMAVPYSDKNLYAILKSAQGEPRFCVVEQVHAMPGQGVNSMFSFGKSLGVILGGLLLTDTPYQLVPPQKWKKMYSLNSDKGASIAVCERLFPKVSLLATPRCRNKHDGMAEALLMAEYGRRINGGVGNS